MPTDNPWIDTVRARREAEATRPTRFAAALLLGYQQAAIIPADLLSVVTEARMLLVEAGVNPNDRVTLLAEIRDRSATGRKFAAAS